MTIHESILGAALRICRERGGWTFRPAEIVAALPGLNAASVRTHVMSRCCVNAPSNHPHRWPYFRRLRRGVYEVRREWRQGRREPGRREERGRHARGGTRYEPALETHGAGAARESSPGGSVQAWAGGVAEGPGDRAARASAGQHAQAPGGIVVEVRETAGEYRAEIPGKADPIKSASLDDVVMRVRDALREGGGAPSGSSAPIQLDVQIEPERIDPVIAKYMEGFDRTLVIESLKMSYEERLLNLQSLLNFVEEIRGAAWKAKKRSEP